MKNPDGFKVWRPGLVPYRDAQAHQEAFVAQRPNWSSDLLILLQHPPVITLGRNSNTENLLGNQQELLAAGVDYVSSRRGGDITLHNPGQLVGYPIVDLNQLSCDLHNFLRLLEKVLILTLADYGLRGKTLQGKTGVWVAEKKIASIGIAVRRWISYHGFALNVSNDLSLFRTIVPCGLPDVTMTSISNELGREIELEEVGEKVIRHFAAIFNKPFLGDFDDSNKPKT